MFAGGDDNKDGDRAYSTYINASYNIACPAEITDVYKRQIYTTATQQRTVGCIYNGVDF